MANDVAIRGSGGGGGGGSHTPVESPDNLRSIQFFRILDLVSEGEIGGLVNGQQSIFLDETPLTNVDGTSNFPRAHVEARTGTQDQTYIPGFDSVENEISVGVELTSESAWLQSITDTDLSAVRVTIGVPALSKADASTGDITGYTINYKIELSTDSGSFVQVYNGKFAGKTTTKFQRSHRIDLPAATSGWQVRVTRLTANADSSTIADTTTIDSYTEIVDAKMRYPNSALVGVMGDASQFSNIPRRSYDLWGRIVRVPANYDAKTRTYATTGTGTSGGAWDGTFKPSWTDNPAWVFYDLVTNTRYGLGNLVSASLIDKWALYEIAKYCDGSVDDGHGGTEPRFTCNVYLQTQADAFKLLGDLTSIFRGITYWAGGAIVANADMPSDPVYTYTDANVIDGKFTYMSSPRKTRYTTALVTWNDPRNFYRQKVEYVEDGDGIARYGIQQAEVTAVGCTSQGQAQRIGRWLLLTSRYETDTVTFSVGLDGTIAAPGQVIRVADSARAGKRQGGRIHSATTTVVTVDKAPTVAEGDTLTCNMPDGTSETRTVDSIAGNAITVASAFSVAPAAEAVWTVESTTLEAQTFRVISVTEDASEDAISFTITALQHNASKFSAVDEGTIIQVPPISSLRPKVMPPPETVTLTSNETAGDVMASTVLNIAWTTVQGAVAYQVEWRKDNGNWQSMGRHYATSADITYAIAGSYVARVRAIDSQGNKSGAKDSNAFTVADQTTKPGYIADLAGDIQDAADEAAAANAALSAIASDNLLTPGEKPTVIRDYNVIITEQPGIDAQATAYGITTQKTAYDGKVSTLVSYMAGLDSPVDWDDLTGNTTIVGSTFRARFADVYTSRQTLLNAIYAAAKTKADAAKDAADAAQATATNASNAVAVVNPRWADGRDPGWTYDNGTDGFSASTGSLTPFSGAETFLLRTGSAGKASDNVRNQGYIAVVEGQVVTATICLRAISANSTAYAFTRIVWRDEDNALIGTTDATVTVGPGGTYLTANSRAVGPAPAGARIAQLMVSYRNHTSGSISASVCSMFAQPASADEVAESSTRKYAGESGADKTLNQLSGNGTNILWDHYSRFGPTLPPDLVASGCTLAASTLNVVAGTRSLRTIQTASGTGTYVHFGLLSDTTIPVKGGTKYMVSVYVTTSNSRQVGCALGFDAGAVQWAFDNFAVTNGVTTRVSGVFTAPTDATAARLALYGNRNLSPLAAYETYWSGLMIEPVIGNQSNPSAWSPGPAGVRADIGYGLTQSGSGQRLGDARNQAIVTVGNFASAWNGLSISYSSTTTSATVTVSAATLQAGSSAISYGSSSITLSGSAGTTRRYWLYYSDPTYAGGSRTLHATSTYINSINDDGYVLVGDVTVEYPSSGSGSGGGAINPCPLRTAWVIRRDWQGGRQCVRAGKVRVGDWLLLADGSWGRVSYSRARMTDCVRVHGVSGSLGCSDSAPLGLVGGGDVLAPDAAGRMLTALRGEQMGADMITRVERIGRDWVQHITCEDAFFLTGDTKDCLYSHHNLKQPQIP